MHISKIGRYELRSTLARSPSSIVHEGWDELIGRKVAIKIIPIHDRQDPETREALLRFAQGARAAGILNHPNIVAVYDYGETERAAYLIMEFVDGMTLKAMLDTQGALRPRDILRIMADVLAALAYSHQHGIVHRDVKPANIMILADGHAKITDFGVARIETSSITQAGTIIGTPAYMSPEQFLGEAADLRTDIYSAGAVLYQMLTGHRPFEGSVATIAHKVLHTEPPRPSLVAVGIPPAFDEVVRRAMARDRHQRYATAQAFLQALLDAADAQSSEATVTRVAAPDTLRSGARLSPSRSRRRRTAMLPVLGGVCAGLALGAFVLWHARTAAPTPQAAPVKTASAGVTAPLPPPSPLPPSATPEHETTTAGNLPPPSSAAPVLPAAAPAPLAAGMPAVLPSPPVPDKPVTDIPVADKPVSVPAVTSPAPAASVVRVPHRKEVLATPPAPSPVRLPAPRPPRPALPAREEQAATPAAFAAPPSPPASRPRSQLERPRVHIYYASGSADAQQMTTAVAQQLLFSDFAYADTRSAAHVPAAAEIRYFHPEDAEAAGRLASLLAGAGRAFQVSNWTDRGVNRPPGTMEVWLGP